MRITIDTNEIGDQTGSRLKIKPWNCRYRLWFFKYRSPLGISLPTAPNHFGITNLVTRG